MTPPPGDDNPGDLEELEVDPRDGSRSAGGEGTAEVVDAASEEAVHRVQAFLVAMGAEQHEVERAAEADQLDLLAIERLLMPSGALYTPLEVAAKTGMDHEVSQRFWRALGFPDIPDDTPAFTEMDLEAVSIIQGLLSLGLADVESAIQLGRVMGTSMARLAEAQVTLTQVHGARGASVETAESFALVADATIPSLAKLIEYAWRRHLLAAARRAVTTRGTQEEGSPQVNIDVAVGFADMAGYTVLSQELDDRTLGEVIGRFEELAWDTVSALGGRVVKMIGDEIMFVSEDPAIAADIALTLTEAYAQDPLLSDLRVGLSYGGVIARDGDYFGPIVNLASRIVNIARQGTVVASADFHDALDGRGEFAWKAIRMRYVKDIGRTNLWTLRRPAVD